MSFRTPVFPRRFYLLLYNPGIVVMAVATLIAGFFGGRWVAGFGMVAAAACVAIVAMLVAVLLWSVLYGMERNLDGTENRSVQSVAVPLSAYSVMIFTITMYLLPGLAIGVVAARAEPVLATVGAILSLYSIWIIPFSLHSAWRR